MARLPLKLGQSYVISNIYIYKVIIMTKQKYELTMTKSDQLLGYSLYLRDWTVKEIATELGRSSNVVYSWVKKFDWYGRKARDLRDIEQEMRDKTLKARGQIIDIGTQMLDDVFVRDADKNIIGVRITVEDVKDLKVVTETILKAGGVPDKVETKNENTTDVTGEVVVRTETIDPEVAAEVGRLLALRESSLIAKGDE